MGTPEDGTYCGFINPQDPCAAQPDGYGPVPTPDTASAFRDFEKLHASASAAPSIIASDAEGEQYEKVFEDLDGSVSAQSYLGSYTFKTYDVEECASKGYSKTNTTVPPKTPEYEEPKDCGDKAIDAPEYWLGSKFFPGPFNPIVCSNYANKQSEANG